MLKLDNVVIKETKYIALWSLIFSLIMEAVFLIIGEWNYTVLLGNLLGVTINIINFIIIGITVQSAVKKDEKDAKQTMKASNMARMFFIFVTVAAGVLIPCFNRWAIVIPLIFPRLAIAIRPILDKKNNVKESTDHED